MNNVRHPVVFTKPATLRYVPAGASVGYDVHEFLAHEALFLDQDRYDDWLTLLATDVVYRCPTSLFGAPGGRTTAPITENACDYNYDSLVTHAKSLRPAVQAPPPDTRVRRLVSNVIVGPGQRPKEYVASSYVLITGARRGEPEARLMTVERQDTLRRCSHSFRLARREIRLSHVEKTPEFALIF
jgi:3-phenylpropionate/cinnamic acid dioxygenase small subunit